MSNPLCSNPRCRSPRHEPGCTDKECAPHPARLAADGLNLCTPHVEHLEQDATMLATLHAELELVIMRTGSSGEKVSGTGAEPPAPRDRVVDARTEIRHTLASWCRLVAEERGIQLPADEVSAMGAYLQKHATWLAAHDAAGDVSDELSTLRRKAWSAAYPTGTKVVEVGPCPNHNYGADTFLDANGVADWPRCTGKLRAVVRPADQLLPSEVVCDTDPSHRWDSTQWRQLDRLVSGRKAA